MNKAVSYWTYTTFNHTGRYTKRYVVYTYSWWWDGKSYNSQMVPVKRTNDYDEFDTITEVRDYINFLNELYQDVEEPYKVPEKWVHRLTGNVTYKRPSQFQDYMYIYNESYWEAEDGKRKFWGYYVFDYEVERVIDHGGVDHPEFTKQYKQNLAIRDALFRGKDEIPKDYKWDIGEYEGWLQFRWGNGLNAIEKEDEINKQKRTEATRIREEKKQIQETFIDEDFIDEDKAYKYLKSLE